MQKTEVTPSSLHFPFRHQVINGINKFLDSPFDIAPIKKDISSEFGFCPDLSLPLWKNVEPRLLTMPNEEHFDAPTHAACHNCVTTTELPVGTGQLLGLNLKFCLELPKPFNNSKDGFSRITHNVRLHSIFNADEPLDPNTQDFTERIQKEAETHEPKLCMHSTWKLPLANAPTEKASSNFCSRINDACNRPPKHRHHNLTRGQRSTLSKLMTRKDLIVPQSDKNLGPAVIERSKHIKGMLHQHLLESSHCERIPTSDIKRQVSIQRQLFVQLYQKFKHTLSKTIEMQCFQKALTLQRLHEARIPQICRMPEPHKKMWCPASSTPAFRPVVSCVNSLPETFSKWVDWRLEPLMNDFVPSIIRDSADCREKLLSAFPHGVPTRTKLFSIDAVGMHSNINTEHAMSKMKNWFFANRQQIHDFDNDFPVEFILQIVDLAMSDNIIQFGDTFWRQLCGTAMGTSAAVNCANFHVGALELSTILSKCEDHLSFHGRCIDDGIGAWNRMPGWEEAWKNFSNNFNSCGVLKWTDTGHVDSLVFLDFVVMINPLTRLISFTSHSKDSNLHLHVPPKSAHQPKMLRGMTMGRPLTFFHTDSNRDDFFKVTSDFFAHLERRGHSTHNLMPPFEEACHRLEPSFAKTVKRDHRRQLFFHVQHHPRGLTNETVRDIHNDTLSTVITNRKFAVLVSRPPNLRERLSESALQPLNNCNPSDFSQLAGTSHTLSRQKFQLRPFLQAATSPASPTCFAAFRNGLPLKFFWKKFSSKKFFSKIFFLFFSFLFFWNL